MKILLTGAEGFLGWHTRVRLGPVSGHQVVPVGRNSWRLLDDLIADVDAIIHIAGVNRGDPAEVEHGNVALAEALIAALEGCDGVPRLVFANSIHAGADTAYGRGKGRASQLLADAASRLGLHYEDVRLPNLFGEHGRPDYNSFVQTFVAAVIENRQVQVDDRSINLLHAQRAADVLVAAATNRCAAVTVPTGTASSVAGVFDQLQGFAELYASGDIPDLQDDFAVDLFNTFRAAQFPQHYPIRLPVRTDRRGALVEVVRAHGAQGQTFVSTTRPGGTRGEHFHLRKIERFVVLRGQAMIRLRRLFHDDVVTFQVDGGSPVVIDMPTMWAHDITNTGNDELITLFWTSELFDPDLPDTYPEPVTMTPDGAKDPTRCVNGASGDARTSARVKSGSPDKIAK